MKRYISAGHPVGGEKLPSSRQLASDLQVSRESVEHAYGQLEAEGYLVRKMGSGSYISPTAVPRLSGQPQRLDRRRRTSQSESSNISLSRRGQRLHSGGQCLERPLQRPFVAGIADLRSFPVDIWRKLYGQSLRDAGAVALEAGDPCGESGLRQTIARHIALQRGVRCSPEQVIVLTSTQQALALCASLLFDDGDTFAIEDPCYGGARRACESMGLRLLPIPVDEDGLRSDMLTRAEGARGVYVTPSHQYPTGATMSLARRQELLEWARTRNAWIIEDDYDSEFHYDGLPTSSVHGLDMYHRTIYVGTFSKTLFPGLRLGYVVVPDKLVSAFAAARSLTDGYCSVVHQLTLARFIEDGHFASYVRRMRRVYHARRDAFLHECEAQIGAYVQVRVPSGGLQAACMVEDHEIERKWVSMAEREAIVLSPFSQFYITPPTQFGWLAGFAAYTPGETASAMKRLKQAWLKAQRSR